MIFDVELINLILYCVQQLGVALGLGAQTIMLVAYLLAMRDGAVDDTEAVFLRATRRVLAVSLFLIVVSGVAITVLQFTAGQSATIFTPAYLFKWLLIGVLIVLAALASALPEYAAEALLGATWYALFVVHILAPVTTWINLLTWWAVWTVGFCLCWLVLVFATRDKKKKPDAVKKDSPAPVVKQEIKPEPVPIPPPPAPVIKAEPPKIILDPAPRMPPMAMPPREVQQAPIVIPVSPAAPASFQPPVSSVKSPANITTDTPFLPQVPPLQPIPVIQPGQTPSAPPTATYAPAPRAIPGVPSTFPKEAPVLQKPEELQQVPDPADPANQSSLSGVITMPKSAADIKK